MTNLSNSSPNVPTVINEDYESYFKQEHLKYLCSQDWKNTENKFMRELKMHNVPGDIDHLLDYLRDEHVKCLEQFKSSGLSASIWEKSFVINEKRFDETNYISSTLPVEELHDLTCLAYKNIDLPVSRVVPGLPNPAAHCVDSYTHVGRSIGNEKLIVLVEIKHKAVNFRQRSEIYSL